MRMNTLNLLIVKTLALPACLLAAASVAGNTLHQALISGVRAHITEMVNDYAGTESELSDLQIKLNAIDQRLKLTQCAKPLDFEHNNHQRLPGRVMIKVSCRAQQSWSLYVPAAVSWEQNVVVSTRPIARGQEFRDGDLIVQRMRITQPGGQVLSSPDQLLGKASQRRMPAGKAVDWRFVEQAKLVRKGDSVVLVANSGSILVKTEGRALSDGAMGEQIRIENALSKRVVKARVVGRGKAEVVL